MELRALTTENERRVFAERQAEARARNGMGFRETSRSQLAKIHLAFGSLYGLFEKAGEPAERMIAGIAMHDLEMFPQSCPKPDLSHLPPRSVLECSDLWSLSQGAGIIAWCAAAAPLRVSQARAILVYLAARPFDGTAFYTRVGFVKTGDPFPYPYLETLDGGELWAQPMILEGGALQRLDGALSRIGLESLENRGAIRLRNRLRPRPSGDRRVSPTSEGTVAITTLARQNCDAPATGPAHF